MYILSRPKDNFVYDTGNVCVTGHNMSNVYLKHCGIWPNMSMVNFGQHW
jgi:hypothetical protein